jgi:hypothetical protein
LHEFKDVCFKQFKECFANHHKAGCLLAWLPSLWL